MCRHAFPAAAHTHLWVATLRLPGAHETICPMSDGINATTRPMEGEFRAFYGITRYLIVLTYFFFVLFPPSGKWRT